MLRQRVVAGKGRTPSCGGEANLPRPNLPERRRRIPRVARSSAARIRGSTGTAGPAPRRRLRAGEARGRGVRAAGGRGPVERPALRARTVRETMRSSSSAGGGWPSARAARSSDDGADGRPGRERAKRDPGLVRSTPRPVDPRPRRLGLDPVRRVPSRGSGATSSPSGRNRAGARSARTTGQQVRRVRRRYRRGPRPPVGGPGQPAGGIRRGSRRQGKPRGSNPLSRPRRGRSPLRAFRGRSATRTRTRAGGAGRASRCSASSSRRARETRHRTRSGARSVRRWCDPRAEGTTGTGPRGGRRGRRALCARPEEDRREPIRGQDHGVGGRVHATKKP